MQKVTLNLALSVYESSDSGTYTCFNVGHRNIDGRSVQMHNTIDSVERQSSTTNCESRVSEQPSSFQRSLVIKPERRSSSIGPLRNPESP